MDTQTITRKIRLYPAGDEEEVNRAYNYIRNGMYAQYQASNLLMGQLASEYFKCNRDLKSEIFKKSKKEILKNSNPMLQNIDFPKGNDTISAVVQKVKADFDTAIKNGLARGRTNNHKLQKNQSFNCKK